MMRARQPVVLATLGFTSIIGQVALMRELVAVFYGNELVLGLILAWWLLWEAAGAWGLGRWAERRNWGQRALSLTLALAALALPLQLALARSARELLGATPGALVPLEQTFWAVGLILAPYCLAHGLGFSLASSGAAAGRAYAYESAGAVFGGALFSFVLIERLDSFQTILVASALTLFVVLYPTKQFVSPSASLRGLSLRLPFRFASGTIVSSFVLLIAALPLGAWLHQETLTRQWPCLVFAADSRYGRLTITGLGQQRAFFQNGLLAFETESAFPEEVVHLPLLAHPAPRRVLLIGGGVAGDLVELFKHDLQEVVYLELDPLVIRAARAQLPPQQAAVLDDPRLRLIYQDGRRYTKNSQERFDVVLVDLPEPSTGQLNRFYTLEFFQEVRALLAEGGVFSLGLPSAENYWNPELTRRNASIYYTLRQVFPHVLVTPGDHNFFVATVAEPLPGPETLGQRLQEREISTRWVTPEYVAFLLGGDRFGAAQASLQEANDVKLNRDLTPICYFYELALWVSRFAPYEDSGSGLRGLFETTSLLRLEWLLLPLALALPALWGRRRAVSLALVGGAGLAGMTAQVALLLAFQALYGYVYHLVGLLVTAFMTGLVIGARSEGRGARGRGRARMVMVQGGIVSYGLGLALGLPLGLPAPGVVFPLLSVVGGVLTGAVFPLAAGLYRSGQRTERVAALLYGADLVGGSVGALFTSAVLAPVLGLVQTFLVVALIGGAGVLLSFSIKSASEDAHSSPDRI